MTLEEKAIWDSVFGASFVVEMKAAQVRGGALFDRSMEGKVETAIIVADEAVRELRRWRAIERKNAGFEIE